MPASKPNSGLRVYGAAAVEAPDREGEVIKIAGIDDSRLRYLNDEHGDRFSDMIGAVTYHRKILKAEDAVTDKQRRVWNAVQAPFLYVEGELADNEQHPNAQAAASLLKFVASRPDLPLKVGFSVEGGIMNRIDKLGKASEDGKILDKTVATGVSLTVKPCNPKAVLFVERDLNKSMVPPKTPPVKYIKAAQQPGWTPSFKEVQADALLRKLNELKKSLEDYWGQVTSLRCHECGKSTRFFKSGDVPNVCPNCSGRFRMSDLYKALSK